MRSSAPSSSSLHRFASRTPSSYRAMATSSDSGPPSSSSTDLRSRLKASSNVGLADAGLAGSSLLRTYVLLLFCGARVLAPEDLAHQLALGQPNRHVVADLGLGGVRQDVPV